MGVSRTIRINAEQDIRVAKTIKKYWNGITFYPACWRRPSLPFRVNASG
jgi:hypothetical protein